MQAADGKGELAQGHPAQAQAHPAPLLLNQQPHPQPNLQRAAQPAQRAKHELQPPEQAYGSNMQSVNARSSVMRSSSVSNHSSSPAQLHVQPGKQPSISVPTVTYDTFDHMTLVRLHPPPPRPTSLVHMKLQVLQESRGLLCAVRVFFFATCMQLEPVRCADKFL